MSFFDMMNGMGNDDDEMGGLRGLLGALAMMSSSPIATIAAEATAALNNPNSIFDIIRTEGWEFDPSIFSNSPDPISMLMGLRIPPSPNVLESALQYPQILALISSKIHTGCHSGHVLELNEKISDSTIEGQPEPIAMLIKHNEMVATYQDFRTNRCVVMHGMGEKWIAAVVEEMADAGVEYSVRTNLFDEDHGEDHESSHKITVVLHYPESPNHWMTLNPFIYKV